MAALLLAGGLGIMGMMSNNQQQKDADRNAASQAENYGIKVAGIDFAAERTAEMLMTKMVTIQDARVAAEIQIDKNQAQAESDAIVNAATAGVSGQSVDAVVNDTERTQAEAKGGLNEQVRQQALQLTVDYTDNFLNAEISKGQAKFTTASSGERTANSALGFVKGFIGGL